MRRVLIGGLAGYAGLATASIVEHFTYHMPEFGRLLFFAVAIGIYSAADAFGLIPGPTSRRCQTCCTAMGRTDRPNDRLQGNAFFFRCGSLLLALLCAACVRSHFPV